jgi:hypothetical protein
MYLAVMLQGAIVSQDFVGSSSPQEGEGKRKRRLWNGAVFIWSHVLRNDHQVLLVRTASSILGNYMGHFLF